MQRFFDIVFSFILILIFLPFGIVISIIIKIESKGHVFYIQERIGKNAIPFKLLKFRTMKIDSDKKGLLTIGNRDARITSFGYYLRKYKIDELPQLINVFIGKMSFVGPRPDVKKYVDMYNAEQLKVLSVLPGITDNASIEYMDENNILSKCENPEKKYIEEIMPHKITLNLQYVNNYTVNNYFKLIFKTLVNIIKSIPLLQNSSI